MRPVLKYVTSPYRPAPNGSFLLLCLGVRVEDPGVPGLPQPNTEPHHRIGPAGRLPALRLLCDWRKVSGTDHIHVPFTILKLKVSWHRYQSKTFFKLLMLLIFFYILQSLLEPPLVNSTLLGWCLEISQNVVYVFLIKMWTVKTLVWIVPSAYPRLEILFSLAPTSSNCTPPSTGLEPTTGKNRQRRLKIPCGQFIFWSEL